MKWYQMQWAQKYWGKEARERYRRYLQSDAWKTKRKAVLQAAGFRCYRCGTPAAEVHHFTVNRCAIGFPLKFKERTHNAVKYHTTQCRGGKSA